MNNVFNYILEDGKQYFADPIAVRRLLLEHTDGRAWSYIHDLDELRTVVTELAAQEKSDEVEAKQALATLSVVRLEGILAAATMAAFGYEPVNPQTGEGMTEALALDLLAKYLGFAEGKD